MAACMTLAQVGCNMWCLVSLTLPRLVDLFLIALPPISDAASLCFWLLRCCFKLDPSGMIYGMLPVDGPMLNNTRTVGLVRIRPTVSAGI